MSAAATTAVKSRLRGAWEDDGHRVVARLDYDTVHLRVECPGDGCKAHVMACGDCEGTGCARCYETGRESRISEFVGGRIDMPADARIVWKVSYDEWEWAFRAQVEAGAAA